MGDRKTRHRGCDLGVKLIPAWPNSLPPATSLLHPFLTVYLLPPVVAVHPARSRVILNPPTTTSVKGRMQLVN